MRGWESKQTKNPEKAAFSDYPQNLYCRSRSLGEEVEFSDIAQTWTAVAGGLVCVGVTYCFTLGMGKAAELY